MGGRDTRVPPSRSELRLKSLMRDELLINVQKFATQVSLSCLCNSDTMSTIRNTV